MGQKIKAGFWKSLFKIKHFYYLIIAALTTACQQGALYGPAPTPLYGVPEYGMPMATFSIDGQITENGTTNGLDNIQDIFHRIENGTFCKTDTILLCEGV